MFSGNRCHPYHTQYHSWIPSCWVIELVADWCSMARGLKVREGVEESGMRRRGGVEELGMERRGCGDTG